MIDRIFTKSIFALTKKFSLLNVIILASHNDFDTNGGAFYDFLISKKYNKKYRIVWLLHNPKPKHLPQNVKGYPIRTPSIFKSYYICRAKYLLFDNWTLDKVRSDQISMYCGHGGGVTLKNIKGHLAIKPSIDYMLSASKRYDEFLYRNHLFGNHTTKTIHIGIPLIDTLLQADKSEITKITNNTYRKIFFWMPTFRTTAKGRVDGTKYLPYGIPMIYTIEQLCWLNEILKSLESLMVIKLHPIQDLGSVKQANQSNILFVDENTMKLKDINNYRLMACADAMLTDYSSVAFTFMNLDRPIGFVLSDMEYYKLGFVVENADEYLPGERIETCEQLSGFLKNVCDGYDSFQEKRRKLRDFFYEYHDDRSCERLAEFLKL